MTAAEIDTDTLRRAVLELIEEVEVLTGDYGPQVRAAVDEALEYSLSGDVAERLYTRILTLLREADGETDSGRIAAEVRQLLAQTNLRSEPSGSVRLVSRNGLSPHPVTPVPIFNNVPIQMHEGFVDVSQIDLWQGNLRVELQVAEFRDRNNREPDEDELLQLMFGELFLPSLKKKDPFDIQVLAKSIARKGVERPPILTADGEPKDGNRRIAAARYVLEKKDFTADEKERARWVKVWVAPAGTTEDQFEAIVVALNFEDDLKQPWPEFVKARMVVREYWAQKENYRGRLTAAQESTLKKQIADQFAIKTGEVTRYIRMVGWAEDFEAYHVQERGRDASEVRYKADDIFQWFYEIQAGQSADKITNQLDEDDDLRRMVYDLMFDVMDAGTQVRGLWKIVADKDAMQQLSDAYERLQQNDKQGALALVKEALITADRNTAVRKKIGFESFLLSAVDKLDGAPPKNWKDIGDKLLVELERVFVASLGVIDGEMVARGKRTPPDHPRS